MFRVRIAPLPDGLHQETHHPSAEDLGLDPEVFSGIEVDLRLDVAERRVLAAYTARATARLECDRTLEMYDEPVEADHAVLFSADAQPDGDDPDDDLLPLDADALAIDLTAPVHDTLLLALPLRRVSPAARAAEIPTTFGEPDDDDDSPADHRWAALRGLRPDGDPDSSD
ncbi:hypothetical protein B1759_07840 [Rubrivirga sp. SAORIC476]|nr:hypothetical protein B1759_07840 [Rubrivirga sp. SAORIC476]